MILAFLIGVWIYECIVYKPEKIQMVILYSLVAVLSLFMVMILPQIFMFILLFLYVYHHMLFFKEERIFGMMIFFFYLFLFAVSFIYLDLMSFIATMSFTILEFMSQRILKREENKTVVYQNKMMKQQVDEVQNIYLTMRGWRHDYHNHLQALKSYLALGEKDEMESYLNDLETELDSIDTQYHTGNINVDAVLNSKLSIAGKESISIECDASVPPTLHVSELDLCVILGNLLDNAVESCRKIEDENQRFIRIYIGVLKQQLYISVTNATNESVKKRTDAYFTSKRGEHGFGLKRVDNCVKKYDGYLNRQNEPGVFATEILLPL